MKYKIVGLRVEKYLGTTCDHGEVCDFDYGKELRDRHVLLLLMQEHPWEKVEMTLTQEEDQCGSGYCTSTEAFVNFKTVQNFAGKTHKLKKDLSFIFDSEDMDKADAWGDTCAFTSPVFNFSADGGDGYYPSGSYEVAMRYFEPFKERIMEKRPVHIFYGDSCACKSYLAALTGKDVLETDTLDELPEEIYAEIIVVGNRNKLLTVDDVKSKIYDKDNAEVFTVEFNKE